MAAHNEPLPYPALIAAAPAEDARARRVADRDLRRECRAGHGGWRTTGYWEGMQAEHRERQRPGIRTCPQSGYLWNSPAGPVADE